MTEISTHVLDLATGRPAAGMPLRLESRPGPGAHWTAVQEALTDSDGRAGGLPGSPGAEHRLVFDVAAHLGHDAFFPSVTLAFCTGAAEHLHVPLLLSPYGYSTYCGS